MEVSSGTLLYRDSAAGPEVLLVHPSGPYHRRAPWSLPKGVPEPGESLEAAARRETCEETGVVPDELVPVGEIRYRSGRKRVHAFAGPAPRGALPECRSWEVDRAEFVPLPRARRLLHPDQVPLVDRLEALLASSSRSRGPTNAP